MSRLTRMVLISATLLSVADVERTLAGPPPRGERWLGPDESVTECSTLRAQGNTGLEGLLSTFYEDGVYRYAVVHVDLQRIPAGFLSDPSAYLIFRVWKESRGTARSVRSLPARLFLYDKKAGLVLRNAPIDRISQNTIAAAMALSHRALPDANYDRVFDAYSVLLSGIDETWEGVTVAGYADGPGSGTRFSSDALLPPFAENPDRYARLGPSAALKALHPFAGVDRADGAGLCARFDSDVRQTRSPYVAVDRPYVRERGQ